MLMDSSFDEQHWTTQECAILIKESIGFPMREMAISVSSVPSHCRLRLQPLIFATSCFEYLFDALRCWFITLSVMKRGETDSSVERFVNTVRFKFFHFTKNVVLYCILNEMTMHFAAGTTPT